MTGPTMRRLSTALCAAFFIAALPSISPAQTRRVSHTATLLVSGDLLIAGGVNETGVAQDSAQILATSRGSAVRNTGNNMTTFRSSHTATLLTNGCVLAAGGNIEDDNVGPTATASANIYNPATNLWTAPGAMGVARFNHTATLLNTGDVLICGGQDDAGNALSSCEIYRPTSCTAGDFTTVVAPSLLSARYNHTALLLKDGRVWFAGGENLPASLPATDGYQSTTERYDPDTNKFQNAAPLREARAHHTATLMGDGKALVVGGFNGRNVFANTGILESAEIYDPTSNSVTPAGAMSTRRQSHAAVLSANGKVIVYNGLGNITTTYVSPPLSPISSALQQGSDVDFDLTLGVALTTATITGGTARILLDFMLNKPVLGVIQNGEVWLSSPMVLASWGVVRFTPASETNSAVGARINLAGQKVDCAPGVCGSISNPLADISQLQGQVIFYPRVGTAIGGGAAVTVEAGGNITFDNPSTISTTTPLSALTGTLSAFTAPVRIGMHKSFIGKRINAGNITFVAGTLVAPTYTVFIASGAGALAVPSNLIGEDADGNGVVTVTVAFSGLSGKILYTAFSGSFSGGDPAGDLRFVTGAGNLAYTTNGANLAATPESFSVDIATVIIKKMIFADAETYNPQENAWTLGAPPGTTVDNNRSGHSATLLANNDTFLFGGRACLGATCATQTATSITTVTVTHSDNSFASTAGAAAQKRAFHTATLLPGGDILVAGGTNGPSILSHAELFTPQTGLFTPVNGAMRFVRNLHTATLLPNGRVLVAGGFTTNATSTGSTNTAEIYYPDTKHFLETSPMFSTRSNHTAILLPNGNVFAAGGFGVDDVITDEAEIFVSTKSAWDRAAPMTGCPRAIHASVQLRDGRILHIGGVNADGPLRTTAAYNPANNTWSCTDVGVMPAFLHSHTATLLLDGRVLVAGGNDGFGAVNKSFIYDPLANTWALTEAQPKMRRRFNHTATLLPNGNVLISGGSGIIGAIPTSIETYHVNTNSWVEKGPFSLGARAFHTMTLGLDNRLYAIGGSNGTALYNTAEAGHFGASPDAFSKDAPPSIRQSTITATIPATPFLPNSNLVVNGDRFRGGTEASGGGSASANSSFSFPRMILQQVAGSGGGASQGNGGFAVDLSTEIALISANQNSLNDSLTVALPTTTAGLPYGWYTLRMGANGVYSEGKMVQVGPLKPTVLPAAVTGVAASISSITWTWNSIAGVDGYNIYNATTGIFISSRPTATFSQTDLQASAAASIIIAGYTLTGDGPLTNSPTSYTLPTTPINVTIASVTFSDLLLFWDTNGNASPGTIYEVTQSNDDFVTGAGISTSVPRLFELTTNFTIISNLAVNTTYFFRVQAFNPAGLGSLHSISTSTLTRAPVTQPIVTARTTISIDWLWTDPGGVTKYRVYNATSGAILGEPISNSFPQVNLGTNTLNSIRVSAVTGAGEGSLSPSASAYTSAAIPNGVIIPTIHLTTGSFLLTWSNNGNPQATVYRTTFTEFASNGVIARSVEITAPPLALSLGLSPLVPSTLFSYRLAAVNGDGIESDPVVGSTWTLPTAPKTLTIVDTTPTTIAVSWDANLNSSSATYQVTYSTNDFLNISTHIAFAAKFGGTSAIIPGLLTGATYSVRVITSNPFGQLSSQFSNIITTRTFNGGGPSGSLRETFLFSSDSTMEGDIGQEPNSRYIQLRAPARTFPSDVTITISPFLLTGPLCPDATNIAFSIVADPDRQPIGSLYLTFNFLAAELGTIPASRALLLRYDPGRNACVPLETTVDSANGKMTARISHFSTFQVGTVVAATSADTAYIFPNPFYPGRDGGVVTIYKMPAGARVRIFTLRGEQVLDVKANSVGLLTWSGNNGSGRSVASGIYLVMIEGGGTKKILKLAVIR